MSDTGNGNATRALIEACAAIAGQTSVMAYYRERLPSETDERLASILAQGMALPATERDRWMAGMSAEARSLYGIYSHRAATLAARGGDVAELRWAVMAFVVSNYVIPEKRNVTPMLALLHHVATECEVEPRALFGEAAEIASEQLAVQLLDFGGRGELVLSRFGWRKIATPDGVQYKFDWR